LSARFLRLELTAATPDLAERAAAEAFAAGAAGLEERETGAGTCFLLYLPAAAAGAVRDALAALDDPGLEVGTPEAVEPVDWSQAWQAGLEPTRISSRLALRPESVAFDPEPGQRVLVIHPGQAFGTGGHASTRLALAWMDAWFESPRSRGARVLDMGCGSGALALAALALGASRAVAFDLDPLAARATLANAARNALTEGLGVFCASAPTLAAEVRFELVVANLLRRELEPLLAGLAARLAPGGRAIFSGLLASDREPVTAALAAAGLAVVAERSERDGGELWIGLLTRRAAPPASAPAGG
jgi:ribosomal protein L11 methyltransferase